MDTFRNSELLEFYGSTEQGWATLLRPSEQLTKLGSVGREFTGSGRIKLRDETKSPKAGSASCIRERHDASRDTGIRLDKTAGAFRGAWLSVGDMARRDEDGFYTPVGRKNNMLISGGENVYPSEIENLLGSHPKIRDVAVIGRPDPRWGEAVHAVIVLQDGEDASESDVIAWCDGRLAGYKRPKSFSFIAEHDMPRTATGKILHRVLRSRF